ncbi:MAG: hypothetical protein CM15mP58_12580 [Burkholderiaceae bacterium]|nr:MAG: hypothetical protein CM15mP58_12580 [Burkholderiaceae bacterium]
MKITKLQNKIIIVSTIITMIVSAFFGLTQADNTLDNFEQSIEMSSKTNPLSLKVVCVEAEGFCELKKVLSEQPEETSFTIPNISILHKYFHYPTFVKIYSLRKEENLTMRSHIKMPTPSSIFS